MFRISCFGFRIYPSRDGFSAGVTTTSTFSVLRITVNVTGKSGYINGVRSLSGYLRTKDGQFYAFSILMNKVSDAAEIKALQEKIVKAVDTHAAGVAVGQ